MIPIFNQSGVIPPFLPSSDPTNQAGMAPYKATMSELVNTFATSPKRISIIHGLLNYRHQLRSFGLSDGIQWIDGSFVEDVEKIRGRDPNDIDLVTFAHRTIDDLASWDKEVKQRLDLFLPKESKNKYLCDAYFVDLSLNPFLIVDYTRYWFGLFSHQRDTSLWKGMIEIKLQCDDDTAIKLLRGK